MLSPSAIEYSWSQILYRLGTDYSGNSFQLNNQRVQYSYGKMPSGQENKADYTIIIQKCGDNAFKDMVSGKTDKLTHLEKASFLPNAKMEFPFQQLPILFWGDKNAGKFATIKGKTLTIHADILAASFFMLSRYEEVYSDNKDKHGRYPFSASVCSRHDLINIPIVDLYAVILKYWLEKLTGEYIQIPHKFQFEFSHDLDYLFQTHPFHKWLGTALRDLVKLKFSYLKQDFANLFKGFQDDQYFKDLQYLVEIMRENRNQDTFFLLTSSPLFSRDGYSLKSKRTKYVLDYLKKNNAKIGLHASYDSFAKPKLYTKEKEALEHALGYAVSDIRQHYLRVRVPQSWRHMQSVGLHSDESYGFSEHEGFRCGTCFAYKVFDIKQDCELDIYEKPLIVMDATLKLYRKLSLVEAEESIMRLADTCRFVNGCFTLLWHNTSISREWQQWGQRLPHIIQNLTNMNH